MRKLTVRELCIIGLFAAVISVLSQISIPLPGGVPMTLQTFIIPVVAVVSGPLLGTLSTCLYLLLGAVGLPVFAGFTGGFGIVLGMTGGFLLSFPFLALMAGWGDVCGTKAAESAGKLLYYLTLILFLIAAAAVSYTIGVLWFMMVTGSDAGTAFALAAAPFLPMEAIKIGLCAALSPLLKKALVRARVLVPTRACV